MAGLKTEQTGRREDSAGGGPGSSASEARGPSALHDESTAAPHDESSAALHDEPAVGDFNLFRQPWLVIACLLLAASVALLLLSHADAAFVCAALGASSWFWNVRDGLKRKHNLKKLSGRNWVQRGDAEDED